MSDNLGDPCAAEIHAPVRPTSGRVIDTVEQLSAARVRFEIGHRVIVTGWDNDENDPGRGMNGYYGHVVQVYPQVISEPMVYVSLKGRVGAEARLHDLDVNDDDPWPFREIELEHAD